MSDADKRTLKVKTGVVKRLRKELEMYAAEVEAESAKVQKLKDEGADLHDIKYAVSNVHTTANTCNCWCALEFSICQHATACMPDIPAQISGSSMLACVQENILAESSAMLPDTRQRLEDALRELQGVVVRKRLGDAAPLLFQQDAFLHGFGSVTMLRGLRIPGGMGNASVLAPPGTGGMQWQLGRQRRAVGCRRASAGGATTLHVREAMQGKGRTAEEGINE